MNPTRSIWDIRAGIVYIMDDNFGGCRIQEKNPKDFLLSINFKNGFKIPIITQELFLNDDFVYMGEVRIHNRLSCSLLINFIFNIFLVRGKRNTCICL